MRRIDADAFEESLTESLRACRELVDRLRSSRESMVDLERAEQTESTFRKVILRLKEMPTVDAEPVRHGHWEAVEYGDGSVRTECSICGYGRGVPPVRNYCPNCGAKMDGKENTDG